MYRAISAKSVIPQIPRMIRPDIRTRNPKNPCKSNELRQNGRKRIILDITPGGPTNKFCSAKIHDKPRDVVTEANKLIDVFSRLAKAHHECGQQYVDRNLDVFVTQLEEGDFFSLAPERQMSHLQWYDEAFLGRGGNLRGLVERNYLPKEFGDEMRTAIIGYLLTTDVSADVKIAMKRYLQGPQTR